MEKAGNGLQQTMLDQKKERTNVGRLFWGVQWRRGSKNNALRGTSVRGALPQASTLPPPRFTNAAIGGRWGQGAAGGANFDGGNCPTEV